MNEQELLLWLGDWWLQQTGINLNRNKVLDKKMRLEEDMGLDSPYVVMLVMDIERALEISISDAAMEAVYTIEQFLRAVMDAITMAS